MNKNFFAAAIICCITTSTATAQLSAEQRIQDSVIGWWSNNRYDHLQPQTDAIGKKKEAHVNKLVDFLKKSYIPVGGLGTTSRYVGKYSFGVNGLVWNVSHEKMWTDEKGNFKPIPEENTKFNIVTNKLYGAWDCSFLSSNDEWYVTMEPDGYAESDQFMTARDGSDPRIHPNAYPFITTINEWCTVYLAPNNKLPLIPVTRGTLLDLAEKNLDKVLKEKREEKERFWPGNTKAQDDAMEYEKKTVDQYRNKIRQLRERYKNSLNEPAYVRDYQLSMYSFETDPDIFTAGPVAQKLKHFYPVYKIDKSTIEKMQGEQPLWVAVAFPFENKRRGTQLYEMYTALSQNLNYGYIYNYFFDPEKIKGKPYTPANEDQFKTRLDQFRKRNTDNINASTNTAGWAPNVHFQENFESSELNGDPLNWYFNKFDEHDAVVEVKNNPGKWLQLGYGNLTTPALLKKPFPQNFTLEFDLITADFPGRYGGSLEVFLSTDKPNAKGGISYSSNFTTLTFKLQAGNTNDFNNNNYSGQAKIELRKKPEVNEQNFSGGAFFTYEFREFNNRNNKIHAAITVKDGTAKLAVNNKAIASLKDLKLQYGGNCTDCSIPANMVFNYLSFKNINRDAKVFVSNIKITKE
ncbi:MAG: hypothetical protein JST86_16695 [Bacteroidetes bacterium]|nr:hypothetical protein [Bacteroidota bacterium]